MVRLRGSTSTVVDVVGDLRRCGDTWAAARAARTAAYETAAAAAHGHLPPELLRRLLQARAAWRLECVPTSDAAPRSAAEFVDAGRS